MKTLMDNIKWKEEFEIESLRNGPFAEIVALSKSMVESFDFGSTNDRFCLAVVLHEKVSEFDEGLQRIVNEQSEARNPDQSPS
jgi:hypothetical protein